MIRIFLNHAIYEIMWKNILQSGRQQLTISRMRIACWIPNATKHSEYVIHTSCFSTATMVQERA